MVCRLSSAAGITLDCAASSTCAVTGAAATVVLEPALAAVGACGGLGFTAVGGSAEVATDYSAGPSSEGWLTRWITALQGDSKKGASSTSWFSTPLTGRFLRACAAGLPFFGICLTTMSSSSSNCACMRWQSQNTPDVLPKLSFKLCIRTVGFSTCRRTERVEVSKFREDPHINRFPHFSRVFRATLAQFVRF